VVPSLRARITGGEKLRDPDLCASANGTKFCACEKPAEEETAFQGWGVGREARAGGCELSAVKYF